MKKVGLILITLILGSLAWMGFIREPLPALPEICADLSAEVPLSFSINSMDYGSLEFALNEKLGGKELYIQFDMANAWKTGRPGLLISAIRENSGLKNGMSPKKYLEDGKRKEKGGKDFSDFMQDSRGKAVTTYAFSQKLVEGNGGKTYMQIVYKGAAMEMLQTLEVPRPITLPAPLSRKFLDKGIIQFQPGTVAFDNEIKGFNIPVVVK